MTLYVLYDWLAVTFCLFYGLISTVINQDVLSNRVSMLNVKIESSPRLSKSDQSTLKEKLEYSKRCLRAIYWISKITPRLHLMKLANNVLAFVSPSSREPSAWKHFFLTVMNISSQWLSNEVSAILLIVRLLTSH